MRLCLKSWTVPIALLILSILSFGLLIPSLGFYWDDWPSLIIHHLQGAEGFKQFFSLDRPTTYLSYVLLMPVLGVDPVRWQIFTLLLRWLTALSLWWLVRLMWPDADNLANWTAMLFAVFPIFRQQSIALTYHQLWMEYVFYAVSLAAMIAAIRSPRRSWWWTLLGVSGLGLNFLISEYFLGMELLRPVFAWLVIITLPQNDNLRKRIRATFLAWLPYLLVLAVYLLWRFVLLKLPGADRNSLVLLALFKSNPIKAIIQMAQMALQDVSYILVANWYTTFQPGLFDLSQRTNVMILGLIGLASLATGAYLLILQRAKTLEDTLNKRSLQPALLFGLLLVLFSPLPAWVTNRQVTVGAWSDRLAVPAMFGASLVLAALTARFVRGRLPQIVLISLLIGLAVGNNLRVANDYRWARVQQNRFYWQLYWRAPGIEPNTAVFAEAEVLPKTGLYSTASGINDIYAQPDPSGKLPYWFYSLSREFGYRMGELTGGMPLKTAFRNFTFEGESRNSLIVYQPQDADCLRILTPQDLHEPKLPPVVADALSITNLKRIQVNPIHQQAPSKEIFGAEPEHGWCYLFEKADLARQIGDWHQVGSLADQARDQGFSPKNLKSNTPQEWIPFIEGYLHLARWEEAGNLTQTVYEKEPLMALRLCEVWNTDQVQIPGEALKAISDLNCGQITAQ